MQFDKIVIVEGWHGLNFKSIHRLKNQITTATATTSKTTPKIDDNTKKSSSSVQFIVVHVLCVCACFLPA